MKTYFSRLTSKGRIVLPRAIREYLGVDAGDAISYRLTEHGVLIEKSRPPVADPFGAFTEWASAEDDLAYREF